MRIMHTSDWHLGKSIHGQDLLEDQSKVLEDLKVELSKGYDALLISGDVYDRSIPPSAAVDLFSGFIESMVELGIITVIIPGNHDSPSRLDFASGVLERSGIHFRCRYDRITEPILVRDQSGEKVRIFALPFVDEAAVRAMYPEEGIRTHQEATEFLLKRMKPSMDDTIPSILIAHAYAGRSAIRSESERELLLGDQGLVPAELFEGFDHVALGHLHRPQKPGRNMYYSGSLIPYSFSETEYIKSSVVLDVKDGRIALGEFPHSLKRRFSCVEASMNELMEDERFEGLRDHYLSVKLTDDGLLIDIHRRLTERFPHVLEIDQPSLHVEGSTDRVVSREDVDDPSRLFTLFLEKFGWKDNDNRELAMEIFDDVRKELDRREVRQ